MAQTVIALRFGTAPALEYSGGLQKYRFDAEHFEIDFYSEFLSILWRFPEENWISFSRISIKFLNAILGENFQNYLKLSQNAKLFNVPLFAGIGDGGQIVHHVLGRLRLARSGLAYM